MPKPNVKEQLVTTSLSLLHSKGFNATSVQDITAAAGVPKGSFYNHFASKEALGLEVLQRYAEKAAELGAALHDTSLSPVERIEQYLRDYIASNVATDFNCGCLLGNFSTELSNQVPAIRQEMQRSFGRSAGVLASVIAAGQRDGSIRNPTPAGELADFVVDAWQGAVLRSKAEHSREPLDRFARVVLQRILA
jgi:TetR/AcrR family transcriptional repressor of nem operon